MTIEVLVSTMHQKDCDFLKSMNISTNAIVINQTDFENSEQIALGENTVKFISNNESGIAKSRNKALENSTADICILADDDMQFVDDYKKIASDVYKKHNADIIH